MDTSSDYSGRHVLITGGAGYIGSLLTGVLLQRGYRVTVVDDLLFGGESLLAYLHHPSFRFVKGDVCDPGVLECLKSGSAPSMVEGECARAVRRRGASGRHRRVSRLSGRRQTGGVAVQRRIGRSGCLSWPRRSDASGSSSRRPTATTAWRRMARQSRRTLRSIRSRCTPRRRSPQKSTSLNRARSSRVRAAHLPIRDALRRLAAHALRPDRQPVRAGGDDPARADHLPARLLSLLRACPRRRGRHSAGAVGATEKIRGQVFNLGSDSGNYTKDEVVALVQKHVEGLKVTHKDLSFGGDMRDITRVVRQDQARARFRAEHQRRRRHRRGSRRPAAPA